MNLQTALTVNHPIIKDIVERSKRYGGKLTPKQEQLVFKLANEVLMAGKVSKLEAPEGRVTFTGVVLTTKVQNWGGYHSNYRPQDGAIGGTNTTKLTVQVTTEQGKYRVFVTQPTSFWNELPTDENGRYLSIIGATVEITATLERSERDASYAFGKRPNGKIVHLAPELETRALKLRAAKETRHTANEVFKARTPCPVVCSSCNGTGVVYWRDTMDAIGYDEGYMTCGSSKLQHNGATNPECVARGFEAITWEQNRRETLARVTVLTNKRVEGTMTPDEMVEYDQLLGAQ